MIWVYDLRAFSEFCLSPPSLFCHFLFHYEGLEGLWVAPSPWCLISPDVDILYFFLAVWPARRLFCLQILRLWNEKNFDSDCWSPVFRFMPPFLTENLWFGGLFICFDNTSCQEILHSWKACSSIHPFIYSWIHPLSIPASSCGAYPDCL